MASESAIISQSLGWILLAILSLIWIGLGIFWGKKAKTNEGFMLAGRNVGLSLGTATAMATWITSNTTMLAPQFALQLGIWGMIAYSTASFGLFLFAPLAKRIRHMMPNGFTSGDFIRLRYGKTAWIIFLFISIFYGFTWLISMGMAGGILLKTLAGIDYQYGMTIILLVCTIYTLYGGLFAVIGTDFIQSVIILIGVVVIGASVLNQLDFDAVYDNLANNKPMLITVMMPAAVMAIFNNLLFGIGEVFHSNVWWSRAFAMRKGIGQKAYNLAGLFWLPVPIAAGFIALASGALGLNVSSPDMVGPLIAANILGKAGSVVVFIVFFSSLASSIDSLLAATSDLLTEDIYKKIINPKANDQQLRRMGTRIVIGLGLLAWLVCLPRIGTLATVLFFAGPLVGSTIWPIASGLYWEKANQYSAIGGMVAGSVVGLTAYFTLGWYTASLISAGVSMLTVIIISKFSRTNYDWNRLRETV
jgi:Na+/proline symporter